MVRLTFSETRLLLPFNSSGAIHGRVPRTPPDTRVLRLILDNPKSPTCQKKKNYDQIEKLKQKILGEYILKKNPRELPITTIIWFLAYL